MPAKSNLLEALGVLSAAASGRVDDESLLRRGVRPGVPRLYKSAFPQTSLAQHIAFAGEDTNGASYSVTLWNPSTDPSPAWKFKHENLIQPGNEKALTRGPRSNTGLEFQQGLAALKVADLPADSPAVHLMQRLRHFAIYSPNTPTLRMQVTDIQSRAPVGLSGGRLPEAVNELLLSARRSDSTAQLLDDVVEMVDWSQDFSVVPSTSVPLSPSAARSPLVVQFVDRYMANTRNRLSGYDASEGALYILFCAVLALHHRAPELLAIDNFDQALNPLLARKLTSALCRWTASSSLQRQWLLTAHNPSVLDGLPLGQPDVRLFAIERDSNGHTCVNRIDLAEALRRRPNDEWTLSRMWVNGYLGAVPNV
ncbi:AAA family ATPase [Azospirillum sp. INR13]|uniref:AAA family ATPase n=1 Tax=Azospirillum sp. INR13 TaxID=2596919 RepID=UPI0019D5385F|nr:ATP-binding protein [Azospirillum sp. INR13]